MHNPISYLKLYMQISNFISRLYKEGLRCIHKEMEKTLGSGQNCTLNTLNTIVSTYVGQPGYYPYIGKIKHYTDFENCSSEYFLSTYKE